MSDKLTTDHVFSNAGTLKVNKSELANAEDAIFWRQVREAFHRVAADHKEEIEFELSQRHVRIRWQEQSKSVGIRITDAPSKPPTLIVPHAAGETDPRDGEG